mgnify:CR=1 FL=1
MDLTLSITAKNAILDGLVDAIDVGSGSAGSVKIFNSANIECASLPLSKPAFGPANNGKVLANSVTNDDTVVAEAASTFQVGRWADLMKYTQPHQWKYDYADTIVDLEALSNDERNCD